MPATVTISVNDQEQRVTDGSSVLQLLEALQLAGQRVAVEINREVIPHGQLGDVRLAAGDRVEIVRAIGGG